MIVCSAIAFSASAQENRAYDKTEMHNGKGDGGMKELNLTDAQKAQMKASREEMRTKMDAIRQNTSLTEDQKKTQMEALRNEQKQKMEAMLTPEQRTKFAELRKNKGERSETMGQGEGKGNREDHMKMKEELGLSDDQATKLKALHESTKSQIEAVKNNTTLSEAAKKEQMKAIKENAKAQKKTILTAEQFKKMEELKGKGHHGHGKGKMKTKTKVS